MATVRAVHVIGDQHESICPQTRVEFPPLNCYTPAFTLDAATLSSALGKASPRIWMAVGAAVAMIATGSALSAMLIGTVLAAFA